MTALILLLWLFLHFSGSRFTAGCRCLLWMIVLLRLCLPFPLLPIPALVQITAAPEIAEPVPPATIHRPNQENLTIHFPADADEPDVVEELLEDTLSAIYREDIPLPHKLPAGVKVEGLEEELPSEEPPSSVQEFTEIPAEPQLPDEPETQEPVITPERPAEELPDTSLPPMTIAGIVWLTGAVGFAGWHLLAYLVCAAPITRTLAEPDASARRIFASLCRKYGIRRPPRLRISPAVRSPMLYGYVRPTVVLPAVSLTANQTVAILAHELTHFRRRDLWGKLACVTGCALHWFNPAVHLAAARCQAEMELSCDESVLAGLDEEARRSYGNVMLDLLRFSACSRQTMPLTTQFPPKKRALRERFVNIMDMSKKKRGIAVILAAALLSSLSGLVFAYDTAPLSPEEEETAIRLNDRVRIRLGFGPLGKYEAVEEQKNKTDDQTPVPAEKLYIREGLSIPLLAEMAESVTVPEQTAQENGLLIEYYQNASLTDGKIDREHGIGFLFGIGRHTAEELIPDPSNPGGLRYFAAEPDHSWFYYIAAPTDVRWTTIEVGKEYAELADFADEIAARVLTDNALIPFSGSDVPVTDPFLSDRAVQGQLCLYTTLFLQPYRSGESYVPDGAVIPESVVWDDLTVTPAASDEYDYLITYPVGAFTMTIRAKVTQNADGTISAEMSGGDYRLSEPIYAESGSLRDLLEKLMREKRTDYTAELRVPEAGNAVLNLLVEGEGRDLHDLKDIFCTSFTANGRTYTFDTPLDLWGAWETEIYEAEGAVVLAQRPTTYSGNTYVLTPNASYEYHPGVFSLVLYEDDGDLRYHHSSALLHAAASRSGDGSSGLLATATSRDNFFSEWGDVTVTDGRLVFYEPDNSVTVGEAYDLDEEFRNYCRQAPVPYATLDALLQSNLLRDGDLYDYPTPDETALPATASPTSVYRKVEGTGIHTSEYRLDLSTENPEGIELTSSVRIPQLNAAGKAVSEWNRSLFARISEECGALLADYAVPGTAERSLTISYEEIVSDGVVSLPITFTLQTRNPETAKWTTESRAEVHHYDTASGKFLTSEEYLLRITDGQFDYKTLAAALNEQKYSFWLSARMTEDMPALTSENITGILPSELDENGFDIYLTFEKMYTPYHEKPLAVHWRESPVFTNEEGMTAAYHLLRAEGGYEVISHVYDPRELPLPEENQTTHYAPNKVYSGGLLDVVFSDDPYGDGIYETITFLNDKGDVTVKESVLGSSRRSASYYFEKYLAGTYDMKTLMENSGSVQAKGSSLLIGILNTYRDGGKPLESAPDFPAGIDIPQRVFVENVLAAYTETGDPAHPFKFAYPLDGGWVMDVYWNIHADAEMVPETIEFRQ